MNDLAGTRQVNPRWRTLAVALAVLSAVFLVVGGLAWQRVYGRASTQERVALAHGLALHAAELRDTDFVTARKLGMAAVGIHDDEQTRAGLVDTMVEMYGRALSPLTQEASREVTVSGDGRVALSKDDGEANVWDLKPWADPKVIEKPDRIPTLKGHGRSFVNTTALSFDGRTALTGDDDNTATVWDLTDLAEPVRLATMAAGRTTKYTNGVKKVALSRDGGTAVIVNHDGVMTVWDLADRSRPKRLSKTRSNTVPIRDFALSADGRTAVTVDDHNEAAVWDLTTTERPVKGASLDLSQSATRMAMSANGHVVLIGRAGRIEVWNLDDRSHPVRYTTLDVSFDKLYGTYDMSLTPDEKRLLLAGPGGSGALWDLSTPSRPARLATLNGHMREVESVALRADGCLALMAGSSGVSFWDLADLDEIVADPKLVSCGRHDERISEAEWARYAGGVDWSEYRSEDSDSVSVCLIDWWS
ncbi:WD40 repeat domain-containing protein [Streptosporangium saharense]|uniref:WD40 repeat protein n=1 Tax=Streptosporangium saharense TaxID=1706840 RepID=A0A7W7QR61_9ACTN|nr:WD40 repeat domain-containing protein [Streptosporangium saharense]MBB4917621.1 WD40 repeat protein [Streptosporangium saharense]